METDFGTMNALIMQNVLSVANNAQERGSVQIVLHVYLDLL
jgi:hypothetical protein